MQWILVSVASWSFVVSSAFPQAEQFLADPEARPPFRCPEPFGIFEDPYQCDKYWKCDNSNPTPRLCDDGLVFDIQKAGHSDPCDTPYVVDCSLRPQLQSPSFVSIYCPRKNGNFAHPDSAVCNQYFTCKEGVHSATTCPTGLHFDNITGICNWPDVANRLGCDTKSKESLDGFTCPDGDVLNDQGLKVPHPTFPNLEDCQLFFICHNGVKPHKGSCSLGYVYNDKTGTCDFPENVPDCYGWYRDHPDFSDYYEYVDVAPADSTSQAGRPQNS